MEKQQLQYKLQVFEGPLDLLLALIAKHKLEITDIPISQLLEQYLEQIRLMQEADMDVASDFLEMAARLVQIKSATLLPRQEEEEDPRLQLAGELLEYEQCKRMAAALGQLAAFDTVVRQPLQLPVDRSYSLTHQPREIAQALAAVWGREKSKQPPKPESFSALVSQRVVSVASQAVYVLRRLWKGKALPFRALFAEKKDRSERVAAFLAVLELVKNRRIRVEGEGDAMEVLLLERRRKGAGRHGA